MRVTSFSAALALGLALASATARANGPAAPPDREAGVQDSFAQATALIQSLADLAPPPKIYQFKPDALARARRMRLGLASHTGAKAPVGPVAAAGAAAVPLSPPAFVGRHLGPFKRQTVFSDFTVSVQETTPSAFQVSVISSEFCEEIQVKDSSSKQVLAKRSLDDEKAFSIQFNGHALDDKVALSIGVLRDGNLNYAFLPLLEGTGVAPTPAP